ncbi:hypothetical protein JHK84_043373 [Glycine max]|nr:hypothetical protein JHK84_043373 [Glycine max]
MDREGFSHSVGACPVSIRTKVLKIVMPEENKRGVDGGTNGGLLATREEDTKMKENNSSKRMTR